MRVFITMEIANGIAEEVHAFDIEYAAREKMESMVVDRLAEYGYDCADAEEAKDIVYNELHGSWDDNIVDFGECDAPIFMILDRPVLSR